MQLSLRQVFTLAGVLALLIGVDARADVRPGNSDADHDVDLRDFAALQTCFTGSNSLPLYQSPVDPSCLSPFDLDFDGDIDLADHAFFRCALGGPQVSLPAVTVIKPMSPTKETVIALEGAVAGWPLVEVSGGAELVTSPLAACSFSAHVVLRPNRVNRLFITGILGNGTRSAPTTVAVTHDEQPPTIFIDFPVAGTEITTDTIDVAGRVGDMLSGALGMTVLVNGREAIVDVGIGNNGTFVQEAVSLQMGENTIVAGVKDALGNTAQTSITVNRVTIADNVPRIVALSGNAQSASIGTFLPSKLVVQMTHADGRPFANKVVTFQVTRSNGRLYGETEPNLDGPGVLMLQVHTDESGIARALWKVGSDAGCGNNRIEVTSRSITGSTFFCASALPAPARQINIGTGHNQQVETGAPAPEPLRAWVSDSCNGVRGIPVTFTVLQGGGKVNGEDAATIFTSATGHAEVAFTLGPEPGNNVIEADYPNNPSEPATFVILGLKRNVLEPTRFTGIVLDNSSNPIENAAVELRVNGQVVGETWSLRDGWFSFNDIPLSGPADLFVYGETATHIGGDHCTDPVHCDVEPGTFPSLHYEMVVTPNANNSLGMPVLLPRLDKRNRVVYTGQETSDVELTCAGMDGLKMIVKHGTTITLVDGTRIGPGNPGSVVLALNQVHHDDVPMPMPDGAAPPFAWTLGPGGAHFDTPVEIVYPNMSSLPAGAISFFLSFNHDTGRFEIIGSGHVSEDGASIHTDPGVGITTAGWGCNCPPYAVTGNCCKPGDPSDINWSFPFTTGQLEFFGIRIPALSTVLTFLLNVQRPCCQNSNIVGCSLTGSSSIDIDIQQPITGSLAESFIGDLEDYICEDLAGYLPSTSCVANVTFSADGVGLHGNLTVHRDTCTRRSGWGGSGTLSLQNLNLTGTFELILAGCGVSGTFSAQTTFSAYYTAELRDTIYIEVTLGDLVCFGQLQVVCSPLGIDDTLPLNFTIPAPPALSLPIALPPPPPCLGG